MWILNIEIAELPSVPDTGTPGDGSVQKGGNVPVIVASFSVVSISGLGVFLVLKKLKK